MAHIDMTKVISSIQLPNNGGTYEIHDAHAIHSAEELGLSAALVFKGTKASDAEILSIVNAKVGDVYLSTATNAEFVCVKAVNGTADSTAWEKLGSIHDVASSNHTHGVTVTGTNASSTVTGQVTVPTVTKTQKYIVASVPSVTPSSDKVLGANTTFVVNGGEATTTKIKATASGVAVAGNGTAAAITGFGNHTTDSVLGSGTTFKATGGAATTNKMVTSTASKVAVTNKSIPNVTANESVTASKVTNSGSKTAGTAASWSASVSNGVLSFSWTANTPTAVTLPTFSDVTATNTSLGTAIEASAVTANDVTVATGALSNTGTGSAVVTDVSAISVAVDSADAVNAITALGTPTTANALTGVQVTSQPTVTLSTGTTGDVTVATSISDISVTASGDEVSALTGVTVGAPAMSLSDNTSTGAVSVVSSVTIGSAAVDLVNGTAAAQTWTQSTGSTGVPQ